MNSVVPAVLVKTQKELADSLSRLDGLVDSVQIDVIDGVFASTTTWPYVDNDKDTPLSFISSHSFDVEVDLMVSSPKDTVAWVVGAGVSRVVIHSKSADDLENVVSSVLKSFTPNNTKILFGIAVHIKDDISMFDNLIQNIDYVQFMGIDNIGRQGEVFDERVLNKISNFRKQYPDKFIQVDGGVSLRNARKLIDSGANRLVVGSAIWRSDDIDIQIKKFESVLS